MSHKRENIIKKMISSREKDLNEVKFYFFYLYLFIFYSKMKIL